MDYIRSFLTGSNDFRGSASTAYVRASVIAADPGTPFLFTGT